MATQRLWSGETHSAHAAPTPAEFPLPLPRPAQDVVDHVCPPHVRARPDQRRCLQHPLHLACVGDGDPGTQGRAPGASAAVRRCGVAGDVERGHDSLQPSDLAHQELPGSPVNHVGLGDAEALVHEAPDNLVDLTLTLAGEVQGRLQRRRRGGRLLRWPCNQPGVGGVRMVRCVVGDANG